MRRSLCAALLVLIAPLQAAEPDALSAARAAARATIDACIPRLDAQLDVGYERIAARCPDLARSLTQSEYADWLPQGWNEARNNLSAGSLIELRAVVERERATRTTARKPRVERLNEVLVDLGERRTQSSGAWSRFKKWLRELMERRGPSDRDNWFDRMVSRAGISDAIVEVITYLALGAMVVLAVLVVLNELKAAGLLGRGNRDGATDGNNGDALPARAAPVFSDIEVAPLTERPRLLLELISAKLTALRRLPPASSLTVRELTHAADLDDAQDRARLATLAQTAERARYSESSVPAVALESAFEQGRELVKRLESLRAPEPVVKGAP